MKYIFFKLVYGFSKYAQSRGKETFHGQSLTYRKWRLAILLLSFFNLLYSYVSSFIQTIKLSVDDQLMSNVLKTNISFTKVTFYKAVF